MADDSEVREGLAELRADLRALRVEHARHETTTDGLRGDMTTMRIDLATLRSEHSNGFGAIRYVVMAVIAIVAGLFGGHVPLPGH